MDDLLKEILFDVLEIQLEKLAKARDEKENAGEVFRITKTAFQERLAKVNVLKTALGLASVNE
jgi:hypothetical protein